MKKIPRWIMVVLFIVAAWLGMVTYSAIEWDRRTARENAPEPAAEEAARLKVEVETGAARACSNYVVGVARMIDLRQDTEAGGKWTGEAVIEFVNEVGGLGRTNVPLAFSTWSDIGSKAMKHVSVILDEREIGRREKAEFDRQIARIRAGME